MRPAAVACGFLLPLLSGCALLSRGAALDISYYEPEVPAAAPAAAPSPGCTLDLGRVEAADDLREEIEYRTPPFQAGYYQERRWTEAPDRYLRRALERRLFEGHRCSRALSGDGPTLDATLVSFAELRAPRAARVSVHVLLHEGSRVLIDTTVEAERAIDDGHGFDGVVRAISDALGEVVSRVGAKVEAQLEASASRAPAP